MSIQYRSRLESMLPWLSISIDPVIRDLANARFCLLPCARHSRHIHTNAGHRDQKSPLRK